MEAIKINLSQLKKALGHTCPPNSASPSVPLGDRRGLPSSTRAPALRRAAAPAPAPSCVSLSNRQSAFARTVVTLSARLMLPVTFPKDITTCQRLGYNSLRHFSCDTQDFLYSMACETQLWSAPMREHVA